MRDLPVILQCLCIIKGWYYWHLVTWKVAKNIWFIYELDDRASPSFTCIIINIILETVVKFNIQANLIVNLQLDTCSCVNAKYIVNYTCKNNVPSCIFSSLHVQYCNENTVQFVCKVLRFFILQRGYLNLFVNVDNISFQLKMQGFTRSPFYRLLF